MNASIDVRQNAMLRQAQYFPSVMIEIAVFSPIFGLLLGVAMPIVSIALDNQPMLRKRKVSNERPDDILRDRVQVYALHRFQYLLFDTAHTLLVQRGKHACTLTRTSDFCFRNRWSNKEFFPAYHASYFYLVFPERMIRSLDSLRLMALCTFTRAVGYGLFPWGAKEKFSAISAWLRYPFMRRGIFIHRVRALTATIFSEGIIPLVLEFLSALDTYTNRIGNLTSEVIYLSGATFAAIDHAVRGSDAEFLVASSAKANFSFLLIYSHTPLATVAISNARQHLKCVPANRASALFFTLFRFPIALFRAVFVFTFSCGKILSALLTSQFIHGDIMPYDKHKSNRLVQIAKAR